MVRRGTGSCRRGTVPIGVHAAGDAGGASCLRRGSALSAGAACCGWRGPAAAGGKPPPPRRTAALIGVRAARVAGGGGASSHRSPRRADDASILLASRRRGTCAAWRSLLLGLEVGVVGVAGGGDLSTRCAVRRRSTNARRAPAAGSCSTYPRQGAFCRIRVGGAAVGFRSGCAGGVACVRTRKHPQAPLAGGKPMTIRAGGSAGGFRSGCCIAGAGGVVCFGTRLAVAADLEQ